jgi:hypothetical protein
VTHPGVPPILSETDLDAALEELGRLWGAPAGTPEGKRLDELITRIEAYETLDDLIRRHSDQEA